MKSTTAKTLTGIMISIILFTSCNKLPNPGIEKLSLTADTRSEILFDFGWRFNRGDIENGEAVDLDDSGWRSVDLPHDWSIDDIPGTDSPIDSTAVGSIATGYTVGGTGWYRKTFFVPSKLKSRHFQVRFDGIYMNADVWLNGQHLGNHPYGYTSFWYDITDKLKFGSDNVLAVKVKNEGRNSRWYTGSGIYRHVWLTILNNIYIEQWGAYITTPEINGSETRVLVRTRTHNASDTVGVFALRVTFIDPQGKAVGGSSVTHTVKAGASYEFINDLKVSSPQLWSVENPALYKAVCELTSPDAPNIQEVFDKIETTFGIRTITFDAQNGFRLNGETLKIKGGCMHHDNGPLGAAAFDQAELRRVQLMKASGFNSIRCAHNPPSPAFLDACDREGILVMDESFDMWYDANNPDDYHLYFNDWWQKDLESIVYRDRNHPSVVMWSIGNEIGVTNTPEGVEMGRKQADFVRALDPTRSITSAVNSITPAKDPYINLLDVAGYNYARNRYVSDHKRFPDRVIVATESFPLEAFDYWMAVLDNQWVIGDYVWTGFDYLGEASIGWMGYWQSSSFYPWTHAYCGDIDICGFKRPQSYYRDALWSEEKNVSIFVKPPVPSFNMTNPDHADWSIWNWQDVVADWTWPGYENRPMEIEVYSNCSEVELFLDEKSLGKQPNSRSTEFITRWNVPYQAGVLRAVGYDNQQESATSGLITAGDPVKISLTADREEIRPDGQDLSYITVEIMDENNVRNPKSTALVNFEITGPGTIVAVGSSNPFGLESFVQPKRKAYQGRCLVIIRSVREPGTIVLTATSEGLQQDEVTLVVK
jgi:beta-galactosidase